jgi:hypothetical protein
LCSSGFTTLAFARSVSATFWRADARQNVADRQPLGATILLALFEVFARRPGAQNEDKIKYNIEIKTFVK